MPAGRPIPRPRLSWPNCIRWMGSAPPVRTFVSSVSSTKAGPHPFSTSSPRRSTAGSIPRTTAECALGGRTSPGRSCFANLLIDQGDVGKPIWLTHFGWAVDEKSVSRQEQADFTVAGLKRARAEWPWMGLMFAWGLLPQSAAPGEAGYAMLTEEGQATETFVALAELLRQRGHGDRQHRVRAHGLPTRFLPRQLGRPGPQPANVPDHRRNRRGRDAHLSRQRRDRVSPAQPASRPRLGHDRRRSPSPDGRPETELRSSTSRTTKPRTCRSSWPRI